MQNDFNPHNPRIVFMAMPPGGIRFTGQNPPQGNEDIFRALQQEATRQQTEILTRVLFKIGQTNIRGLDILKMVDQASTRKKQGLLGKIRDSYISADTILPSALFDANRQNLGTALKALRDKGYLTESSMNGGKDSNYNRYKLSELGKQAAAGK